MTVNSQPGCFGYAVTCAPETAVCKRCNFMTGCSEIAQKRAERVEKLVQYQRNNKSGTSV